MLRLPDAEVIRPAADDVINVLHFVILHLLEIKGNYGQIQNQNKNQKGNTNQNNHLRGMGIVESVLDVIKDRLTGKNKFNDPLSAVHALDKFTRSEERRVGKEC